MLVPKRVSISIQFIGNQFVDFFSRSHQSFFITWEKWDSITLVTLMQSNGFYWAPWLSTSNNGMPACLASCLSIFFGRAKKTWMNHNWSVKYTLDLTYVTRKHQKISPLHTITAYLDQIVIKGESPRESVHFWPVSLLLLQLPVRMQLYD